MKMSSFASQIPLPSIHREIALEEIREWNDGGSRAFGPLGNSGSSVETKLLASPLYGHRRHSIHR